MIAFRQHLRVCCSAVRDLNAALAAAKYVPPQNDFLGLVHLHAVPFRLVGLVVQKLNILAVVNLVGEALTAVNGIIRNQHILRIPYADARTARAAQMGDRISRNDDVFSAGVDTAAEAFDTIADNRHVVPVQSVRHLLPGDGDSGVVGAQQYIVADDGIRAVAVG
ncbi:hypothetical protein D1872_260320 [compost metagenome]